jgi:NAD(P)-dependent dehydrogenase (short-subunit alcohol dehydrogenase family)
MTSPTVGAAAALQALAWTMNQEDSGGYGKTISVSVTVGTVTATSGANIDWTIGASNITSDNTTVDDGVSTILSLTANDAAVAVPAVTTAVSAAASMGAQILVTTKTSNTHWGNGLLTTGAQEPITDVRAKELVNAIAPGFFRTNLTESLFQDPDKLKTLANKTMIGRNGEEKDIFGISIFLCSDANSYVTGQTIFLDGGFSAA